MDKDKYYLEYIFENTSHKSIWRAISCEDGLATWFADEVTQDKNIMTFHWKGSEEERAKVLEVEDSIRIKYQWLADAQNGNDIFFEFNIYTMELSGEKVLEITDFASPSERLDSIELWDMLIGKLRVSLGVGNR